MTEFGHNLGYIDELYRRYLANPASVSEAWREFFKDYRPGVAEASPTSDAPLALAQQASEPPATEGDLPGAQPLRGIAVKIAENMSASLSVPTATSARSIAVKLLEENRRVINSHQAIVAGPKISFTHLIAWTLLRALERHPRMNARFAEIDGQPHLVPRERVNLGLAIDVERKGERVLLVPTLKDAASLSFPDLVAAYDQLVVRARKNQLTVDDFQDTTVTLTNPGMLGTAMSVPRLMRGQGVIVGVGSIGYPAEYSGMAAEMISELGLSKVMTVTSTYDHRVIQGAESGQFLATLEQLIQGTDLHYERIFGELGVPREPFVWAGDRNPQLLGGGQNTEAIAKQAGVLQLIRAYRVRGHLWADLNPLEYTPQPNAELELPTYGLSAWDLDRRFIAGGLAGQRKTQKLRDILDMLNATYCRHIGAEFMHIPETETRHWIHNRLEDPAFSAPFSRDEQIHVLKKLNAAEAFETFLHTNYVGQKRFSLEGAETLLPMLDVVLQESAATGMDEVVIGMSHRGRLNVLAHVVGKSYGQIFEEFEGIDPETTLGSGDVKYHLGAVGSYTAEDGRELVVSMASNPSHLEAVDPVIEGMVRAKQDRIGDLEHERVLPVLIHGDAAFSGQGVVAETLNLSLLRGYRTGGTVHIVINNQIGFTTRPDDSRSSSRYPTDVAKMLSSPILHVNGDFPEDAVRAMRMAFAFRQQFRRDVVIDLVCYRRWGHNEGDDPSYTNPILYSKIEKHRSARKLYTEQLVRRGDFDLETAEQALEDYRKRLREVRDEVLAVQRKPPIVLDHDRETTRGLAQPRPTAVPAERLRQVLEGLERMPDGFEVHPKLARQLSRRGERFEQDKIDWALAESLAFGTLVLEGTPVRLSGEDSGRGTFSQRHAILYDYKTAKPHAPLSHLSQEQAPFNVFDSLLSEFAVLGFDYGYSVCYPEALVLWEAQFGDFCNGAQVIIDQFLASAEDKWDQRSSVLLLLPHGYEGQGPEHSNARLERFLQLAAHGNLQVQYPSTPAQYFHLLREQVRLEERHPGVVMTPKSLLRHPAVVSAASELSEGAFQVVLDDPRRGARSAPRKLVLCSGKVFYDLDAARERQQLEDIAICRVEQLYPFPADRIAELLAAPGVVEIVWAQEEPENMGAWTFVRPRLESLLSDGQKLRYVGRRRAASPATGSHQRHLREQEALVEQALSPKEARVEG